jgi:hypothetical protein
LETAAHGCTSNEEAFAMTMVACAALTGVIAWCAPSDPIPSRGYIGIDVVQRAEGLMVWRVLPGPLDGNLVTSETLARGDLISTIDGEPAGLAAWDAIRSRPIGTPVRIGYREGRSRGASGAPNADGAVREAIVTVDDAAIWSGWHRSGDLPPLPGLPRASDTPRDELDDGLALLGPTARGRAEAVLASLDGIAAKHGDPATPPLLRGVFRFPGEAEAIVKAAIPAAQTLRTSPFRGAASLAAGLAGAPASALPEAHGSFKIEHAQAGV